MVTTRSAEKQATANGKIEELTLRSKPEESSPLVRVSPAETSASSSTKIKTMVTVDVPPPRKRTRLSYNASEDKEAPIMSGIDPQPSTPRRQEQSTLPEIPDSQETITKLDVTRISAPQPSPSKAEEVSTSQTLLSTKRKRKVAGAQKLTISATTVAGSGEHKRFGSEDPTTEDDTIAVNQDDDSELVQPALSDNDDAPEATTTKAISAVDVSRKKRSTRAKKASRKVEEAEPELGNEKEEKYVPLQPIDTNEKKLQDASLPALKVNTEYDPDTSQTIFSDDSQDSAFVTARTTRHHDIFATPLGGTPRLPSPLKDELTAKDKSVIPAGRGVSTLTNLSQNISSIQLSRNIPDKISVSNTAVVSLPSKPGQSLEHYRKQMLINRAEKDAGKGRGRRFKLQEEWSGKSKKFVMSH